MAVSGWETAAAALAILTPLVAVPLTVITFYLKGLREQQAGRYADLAQRVEVLGATMRQLGEEVSGVQRNYTTKEEWLREGMWARGRIEKLRASMTRVETELDGLTTLLATAERTARTVSLIGERPGAADDVDGAGTGEGRRGKESC